MPRAPPFSAALLIKVGDRPRRHKSRFRARVGFFVSVDVLLGVALVADFWAETADVRKREN